jgi:hypothetical protein
MRLLALLLLTPFLFAGEAPEPVTKLLPQKCRMCLRVSSMDRLDALGRELQRVVKLIDKDTGDFVRRLPLSASFIHDLGLDASDPFDRTKPLYVAFVDEGVVFFLPIEDGKTWEGERKLDDGRVGVARGGMICIGKPDILAMPLRDRAVPFQKGDAGVKIFVDQLLKDHKNTLQAAAAGALPPIPVGPGLGDLKEAIDDLADIGEDIQAIDYSLTWKQGRLESEGLIRVKDGAALRAFLSRVGPPGDNNLTGFLPDRQFLTLDFVAKPGWPGSELIKVIDDHLKELKAEADKKKQGQEQPQPQPQPKQEGEIPRQEQQAPEPQPPAPAEKPEAQKVEPKDVRALAQAFGLNTHLWEHTTGKMAMGVSLTGMSATITTIIEGKKGADLNAALLKLDPDAMNAAAKKTEAPFNFVFEPRTVNHNGVEIHRLKRTLQPGAMGGIPVPAMPAKVEFTTCYATVNGLVLTVSSMIADPTADLQQLIDRVQKGERLEPPHIKALDRLGRRHNVGLTINAGALKVLGGQLFMFPEVAQALFLMPDDLSMTTVISVWDGNIHWRGDWPVEEVAKIAGTIQAQEEAARLARKPEEEDFE